MKHPLLCFIDLETTGTNFERHAVTQISGTIAELIEGSVAPSKTFDFLVKSFEGAEISEQALEITGKTREDLEGHSDANEVYRDFVKILGRYCSKFNKTEKFWLVGYNARFDYDFLRKFFERQGDKYFGSWFWFPPIDVMNMAAERLMKERHAMLNFKLGTVADKLGVEVPERLHDASVDIALTRAIYDKLRQ